MNQIETIYICTNCDAQTPKWMGRCSECGKWGTLKAQSSKLKAQKLADQKDLTAEVQSFEKIAIKDIHRITTGINEFDRVLGGGIVPGSLTLVGGEPGIGKSTLIAQVAEAIPGMVLYVSGEESAEQIKMRLDRLSLSVKDISYLGEIETGIICQTIRKNKPIIAIIDSIQTVVTEELPSEAGSVNQVRAATVKFLETAKKVNIPIIIIGHVTKGGEVAGPKTLEHLVDAVLYLEGDQYHAYRILRGVKNRFGSTQEVGVFDMQKKGLVEVKNPSKIFLENFKDRAPGSAVTAIVEGSRSFLLEVQSLVTKTNFGYPQRKTAGFDLNRLQLLIAVLTKRAKVYLDSHDVHVNIAGGLRISEPASDLAVCLAIASSFKNKSLDPAIVVFGEVGLGGEIRTVSHTDKRLAEAKNLGFKKVLVPAGQRVNKTDLELIKCKSLSEAVEQSLI